MAEKDTNLYLLSRITDILQRPSLESLSKQDQQELSQVFKLFLTYKSVVTNQQIYNIVDDLQSFFEIKPYAELEEIKEYIAHPPSQAEAKKDKEEKKEKKDEKDTDAPIEDEDDEKEKKKPTQPVSPPPKEVSTIPADLETLVALYKESQTNSLEENPDLSVANAVKRARRAWLVRHEADLIRENRLKQITDNLERKKQRDAEQDARENFIIRTVDPKETSSHTIYNNLRIAAEEAIRTQYPQISSKELAVAIDNLEYLTLSGAINLENSQEFYIGTQLALKEAGISIPKAISEIDDLEINRLQTLTSDPYSDKPEEIEEQIRLADIAVSSQIKDASVKFQEDIQGKYKDFDLHYPEAIRANNKIQSSYLKAIPNASLPTLYSAVSSEKASSLEAEIRRLAPDTLTINPTAGSAKYSGLLLTTQGSSRQISPESVRFLGLGLTNEKLDNAKNNPDSPLGKLYHSKEYGDVFKQVHFQIKRIQSSKAGREIEKGIKPVSAIDKFYNKLSPTAQAATKLILNPRGTITSWASRQSGKMLGQSILNYAGSETAKKLGNYLLEEGLQAGVRKFATQAVGKVVVKAGIWVATRLGWSAVAESLNAVLPGGGVILDILGQIVIWVAEKTVGVAWNQFQNWHREIYGSDFSFKEASIPVIAGGVTLAGIGAFSLGAFIAIRKSTQIAIVSMIGILVTSTAVVLFYIGFAYAVAPLLSTLVQLDSQEQVEYEEYYTITSSGDCGWPTAGHYSINTGPTGGTHYKSKLEAIDIGAPDLSAHLSGTDGVVTFTGVYSNYGNTVIVQTNNAAGSFDVYYGHLSQISVGKGQQVKKGQKIGLVGGSGGWSPHIHMEYKGIKYNQCPAGGLQIKVGCCSYSPAPQCTGACNAFSN